MSNPCPTFLIAKNILKPLVSVQFVRLSIPLHRQINNPGLVKHHCRYAKKNGSIGAWEKFAIFSNPSQGHRALKEWLHSKTMLQCDLCGIAKHYQISSLEHFLQALAASSKIPPKTKLKDLTQSEFDALLSSIEKLCGFSREGNEEFYLLPKIAAKIECLDDALDMVPLGQETLKIGRPPFVIVIRNNCIC